MLSAQEWILIGIIAAALLSIASGRFRPDLVALLVLILLPLTGLVTFQEAISGFSRSAVITLIGLFMITEALEDTGIVLWIADRMLRVARGSRMRLDVLFMGAAALLSLVMNNIAVGAVLLPAAIGAGREARVAPSKLLIPISFGALLGGMATYFTTANILLSSILVDQGQPRLGMVQFLPTGSIIVLAGLTYMALWGQRLLPTRESVGQPASPRSLSDGLYETYSLDDRLWQVRVLPGSQLVNAALRDSGIGHDLGLAVVGIARGARVIASPQPAEVIQAQDVLLLMGREERVQQLAKWGVQLEQARNGPEGAPACPVDLTEVVIPPRSSVVGKSLSDLQFRSTHHLSAIALWREGRSFRTDVGTMALRVGDALLMTGSPGQIAALAQDRNFLMLQSGHSHLPLLPDKAAWAAGITISVVALSILEILPTAEAMIMGGVAMALTGCINLDEAYRAIEWRVLFLIVGMLPISIAMIHTGLAERLGTALVAVAAPLGALSLIAVLFVASVAITQVVGGQVAALILGPIAVTAALQSGINPQAVAVGVATACSTAFLTPIAHPINVLMMGPGGYTFRDFFRVGLGMTLVTFVTLLVGLIVFWGI